MYNLTGHFSLNKQAYNAVCAECDAGRGGNDIASSLTCILTDIMKDYPNIKKLILRLDSRVPQNKNYVMVSALKKLWPNFQTLKKIEQKLCTPGHSSIQEVDNVHSHTEKALNLSEIFSPVSFVRVLSKVRPKSSKVLEVKQENFLNFQKTSQGFKFSDLPFTKVKCIILKKGHPFKPYHAYYKTSFSDEHFIEVSLID